MGPEHGTNCSLCLSPEASSPFQISPFSTRPSLQNTQKMVFPSPSEPPSRVAVPTQITLAFCWSSGYEDLVAWISLMSSVFPHSTHLGFRAMWMFSRSDSSNFCLSLVPWPTAQLQYFFFPAAPTPTASFPLVSLGCSDKIPCTGRPVN